MKIKGFDGNNYSIGLESGIETTGLGSGSWYLSTDIDELIVPTGEGLIYLGKPLVVSFSVNMKSFVINIPFGYSWDGASIPSVAEWLVGNPLDPEFRVASMLHDGGYEDRTTRVIHDCIFYYMLRYVGVPKWKAMLMFAAVRIGGHVYYAAETSRFWRVVKSLFKVA